MALYWIFYFVGLLRVFADQVTFSNNIFGLFITVIKEGIKYFYLTKTAAHWRWNNPMISGSAIYDL